MTILCKKQAIQGNSYGRASRSIFWFDDVFHMCALDKSFVTVAGLLLSLGLVMVFSASVTSHPTEQEQYYLTRQVVYLGVALLLGGTAAAVPQRWWMRLAPAGYLATLLLLGAVLLPGVGVQVNGAQRWIRYAGLSMQPSEFAKLTLPLFVCRLGQNRGTQDTFDLKRLFGILLTVLPALLLIALEPDLGTVLYLVAMTGAALFLLGWPGRHFVLLMMVGGLAAAGSLAIKPYQRARIEGYIASWQNDQAAPYQVRQSIATLGVGGFAGTGIGRGTQKLSFLPEANTDFVFSVIGEELGFVGTSAVVLLWTALLGLGLVMVRRLDAGSSAAALAGTLLLGLVFQAVLNIAVVTALLPPKGIALPLISYGGSSLTSSMMALGMIVSLTRNASPRASRLLMNLPDRADDGTARYDAA